MLQVTEREAVSTPGDDQYTSILRTAKIAVIDDEPINIEIVQAYLEEAGYQNLICTTDSTKALELIHQEQPDAVLTDIMMPEVSGLDLLVAMRADERTRRTPVIVLTASTDSETKLQALQLGSSDFLAKPVDASELTLRLRNVLSVKVYQDDLAQMVSQQKELLDRTFTGAVCMLTDIIESIETPVVDSAEVRAVSEGLMSDLDIQSNWTMPLASRLLVAGLPLLTQNQREVLTTSSVASASHREIVNQMIDISSNLIRRIPRLEAVLTLMEETLKVDGTLSSTDSESRTFATILLSGFYVDLIRRNGGSPEHIVEEMQKRFPAIDRGLLASTKEVLGLTKNKRLAGQLPTIMLEPEQLEEGMIVATKLSDHQDRLLVAEGRALTRPMIERLKQMGETYLIKIEILDTSAEVD